MIRDAFRYVHNCGEVTRWQLREVPHVNTVPLNAIVLLLGGPNDGFIEVGEATWLWTTNLELPKKGEVSAPATGQPSAIGKRIMTMPKCVVDGMQKIGMEKTIALHAKYGKTFMESPAVYELDSIDGDVYVYKYIGLHKDVFPDKK